MSWISFLAGWLRHTLDLAPVLPGLSEKSIIMQFTVVATLAPDERLEKQRQNEWNSQFRDTLSRAASSVQRFAEQDPTDAELQHLGEQFLASAQTLAEQSEAALSNVADKVTGGVSSLGLTSEDSPKRSGDLDAQRFVREAKQLESAGGTRLMVAEVAEVLHTWQERLSAPGKGSTSALKALLQRAKLCTLP
ncbi:unnamed protein product [Effrenium voratum]|uniref:Uncharacterized protein n=1 Tax=Effrenium voratum TaxID=2562239 RepID=A0AA36HS70_9DINO|nr:unnamed protein product [Effrenium voratum]